MKRFLSTIIGILCLSPIAFSQDYYCYHGEKIALQQGNQRYIIFVDDIIESDEKKQEEEQKERHDPVSTITTFFKTIFNEGNDDEKRFY